MTTTEASVPVENTSIRLHILAAVMLAMATWYLLDSATDEDLLDVSSLILSEAQEYDYFMSDMNTLYYGEDGLAEYRLQAVRLTHYPRPEYSDIDAPRIILYHETQPPWTVTSDSGRYRRDSESGLDRLDLEDNVLVRHRDAGGEELVITTTFLTVYPENKRLQTDREVTVNYPDGYITARGMIYDYETRHLTLLSDGVSRFQPR